jgi:putative phosphoesterase
MKVLVVSDSHGQDLYVAKALDREWPIDAMLHLGDSQEDQDEFACILAGEDVPLYMVRGNCDYDPSYPLSRIVELAGHRILMVHGHLCSVSAGTKDLVENALGNACDIAIFGHTHKPVIDDSEPDLLILNPGSITYPRQAGRKKSYIVLELEEGKKPEAELRYF